MHREELVPYLYEGKRPTKGLVASCVMGFFDPLGILSLFTIHGKIIIQHLWRSNCDWDQDIDSDSWELWKRWVSLLPEIEAIRIPRCYLVAKSGEVESLEVHIFTDASEHGYGCVAYLRSIFNGKIHCNLMMSRAKVAPIKRQSIPRLELMGAVLGARMSQTILSTHSYQFKRTVFWTDSRTICSWINSDQHRFKQFVAFRVSEIQEITKIADWRWIPTKLNIADVLTKCTAKLRKLVQGTSFSVSAARTVANTEISIRRDERRSERCYTVSPMNDAEPIARWTKLLRVTASVIRFINNCRRKKRGEPIVTTLATTKQKQIIEKTATKYASVKSPLGQEELHQAETILWLQVQWDCFPAEMSVLTKNLERPSTEPMETVQKKSQIYKSSPVLDEIGVLRVDGRLANSEQSSFDKKHPIILSRTHKITQMLIQHYHETFGHANPETVFNETKVPDS